MYAAVIMRILGQISESIRGRFTSSKRDIFYLDPICFGSQRVVDECIDDIASTIGVDRAALHVVRLYPILNTLLRMCQLNSYSGSGGKRLSHWKLHHQAQ